MTEKIVTKYWSLLAARHDGQAFATLDAAYREPQRAYHAWGHIVDLLTRLDALAHLATRVDLVAAAIFWHDSVYLTLDADGRPRSDAENVAASADLFARHSLFDATEARAVHDLIMATTHHMTARAGVEHYPGFARDHDFFLDLDLASLSAPWPMFEKNLNDIQFEYAWIPESEFCESRLRMLRSFLAGGDRLYRLPETRALWTADALANLRRAEATLRERMGAGAQA